MVQTQAAKKKVTPFGYHFVEPACDLAKKGEKTLFQLGVSINTNVDELLAATKRKTDKRDFLPWAE